MGFVHHRDRDSTIVVSIVCFVHILLLVECKSKDLMVSGTTGGQKYYQRSTCVASPQLHWVAYSGIPSTEPQPRIDR